MKTIHHEIILKSKGRASKFVRSTEFSEMISHNFMISQSLQIVNDKCKKYLLHLYLFTFYLVPVTTRTGSDPFQEMCMEKNADLLKDPECENCNKASPYRTITGCCNNLANKDQGRSNQKLERLITPNAYEDGKSVPRGGFNSSSLPSPRLISRVVHGVEQTAPKPPVSVLLMQFAQFLDHDLSLTPEKGN